MLPRRLQPVACRANASGPAALTARPDSFAHAPPSVLGGGTQAWSASRLATATDPNDHIVCARPSFDSHRSTPEDVKLLMDQSPTSGAHSTESQRAHLLPSYQPAPDVLGLASDGTPLTNLPMAELLEKTLGDLFIDTQALSGLREVGEGGFATVQSATLRLKNGASQTVAVKQLKSHLMSNKDFTEFIKVRAIPPPLCSPCKSTAGNT